MIYNNHFIFEDFFDDSIESNNDFEDIGNLQDEDELTDQEKKENAEMVFILQFSDKYDIKTVEKFIYNIASLYDLFKIFYYEIKTSYQISKLYIYYTLKQNIKAQNFYIFTKMLINFIDRHDEYRVKIRSNLLNKRQTNYELEFTRNTSEHSFLELTYACNFFINNIFDDYSAKYGMNKISKILCKKFMPDQSVLNYLKDYGTLYLYVPLFEASKMTDYKTGDYAYCQSIASDIIYIPKDFNLDIDKIKDYKYFPQQACTFNVSQYKKCLKSSAYSYQITITEKDDYDYCSINDPDGKYVSYWHNLPFYVTYFMNPLIISPAIAVEMKFEEN